MAGASGGGTKRRTGASASRAKASRGKKPMKAASKANRPKAAASKRVAPKAAAKRTVPKGKVKAAASKKRAAR